ncbi:MAG: Tyrosine-specific transport protein [Chlamydiales bacterium]|nr:Tyrosine-specific transport protein [Chlamydiales bacterium]MCH9635291.1 Tyrosine-specific transport protein [Chlamydiales bacterium]MCH9704087.1 amino acid transporter [Chlamydiota bacterium]
MSSKGTLLGATMLVAGTCIGGGMLAFPVATAEAGFIPSIALMLLGWAFMTMTALYLSEVNLWMEPGSHVITMASKLLGFWGKAVAWLLYLFISYASLVAYTAGGGELVGDFLRNFFPITDFWASILFVFVFGFIVYLGNIVIGRINTILMVGLIVSYILLILASIKSIDIHNWMRREWSGSFVAMPLLLSIFSFQTIIPSLTIYLKQDGKLLRRSILYGTIGAFCVYLLWQAVVLGVLHFDNGLGQSLAEGKPATKFFGEGSGRPLLGMIADFFAFFALVTSFLGIGLGLFDFLADGLKIPKVKWGALLLGLLIVIPTLLFALNLKQVFLLALDTSGGIGDTILNAFLPALMLWVGRYKMGYSSQVRIFGGRPMIVLVMCYALLVFALEMLGQFGVVKSLGG